MDYSISPEQLDKLIKPFFDKEFKHAKWGEHSDNYGGGTWYGFINQDDVLLVGYPSHDSDTYFTNGQHFSDMWQFFSIDGKEFNDAMGRYLKKKYGSDFNRIM
jgi:hypothetical protein